MLFGRRGKTDGIDMLRRKGVNVANNAGAKFGGNLLSARGVLVDDPGELDGACEFGAVRQLTPDTDVVASEFAYAYDGYANGLVRHN